ncbi:tetraacyldisaccharide 4'-kinase [Granulicella arctica]|uniref:Tetraacyldisaccharide 4'-kinase n=1 Tax=Granulicella arctica TaxID=940613 RepID=A0A7Y9PGA9_9BACT|nr:tetraacyldisaccharide 4'-kinase [Granulicella arctica]NYF79307.1 tetraacyldisaccharide 4'-kinase [Granulicella arctica]
MSVRRPLLLPLVPLYAAGLRLKRRLFSGEVRRLAHPVISVGSLSAGGAGKTPVVQALVELLVRHGYAVDVLSRGYGRGSGEVERVDPAGEAQRYGDEPLLIARRTGAPVYVGTDRYAAGLLAEREAISGKVVHLLDDGFQHRRLARSLDIVLLTQEDVEDCLLPAGNLREPLHRLQEAGAVVLREEEETALRPVVSMLAGETPVWVVRRRLELPVAGIPQRPVAFCGIARPEGFFAMLRAEGVIPTRTMAFGDHHAYGERDIDRLLEEAREAEADGFVTTEKDAVKISEAMRGWLERIGPVIVTRLGVAFLDEDAIVSRIAEAG